MKIEVGKTYKFKLPNGHIYNIPPYRFNGKAIEIICPHYKNIREYFRSKDVGFARGDLYFTGRVRNIQVDNSCAYIISIETNTLKLAEE